MATIRADEISTIIRERIEQYNREVKVVNTGIVLQVGDGIARIHGLDEVMADLESNNDLVSVLASTSWVMCYLQRV
ncbi:hypothetical protein MKW92_053961 [Papaver armeniacum]|nr:hypothetical protein MKW92_053961 [Papaver armeniacum]